MRTLWWAAESRPAGLRHLLVFGAILLGAWRPSLAAEADLSLAGKAVPQPAVVDRALTFYLELVNQGPDSAEDVVVEIDLPAEVSLVAVSPSQSVCHSGPPLVCELGQVEAYPANRAGIAVETVAKVVAGISLTATASAVTPDPVPDNNYTSPWLSAVALRDSADLRVGDQILPQLALAGAAIEYVIEVANDGPVLAYPVEARVAIEPLRLASFVSASSSQGQCLTALNTCAGFHCLTV